MLVALSHLYTSLAPGFAQTKLFLVAGILGEGDRYEILKLSTGSLRELWPSQAVLLLFPVAARPFLFCHLHLLVCPALSLEVA